MFWKTHTGVGKGGVGGKENLIWVQKVSQGAGPEEVEIQRRRSETLVDRNPVHQSSSPSTAPRNAWLLRSSKMSLAQSVPLVVEVGMAGQGDGAQGRGSGLVDMKSQDWTRTCILQDLSLLKIQDLFFKDCTYFLREREHELEEGEEEAGFQGSRDPPQPGARSQDSEQISDA